MLKLSSDLGLSLVATTTRFIKFAAAARNSGLAMKDTQKIFSTMAKAGAVLGLRTDELSGVFLALEQMLSKGKVTTEELRRQLGERLPGAFGIMAASLGVTLPKLDKMLKAGEILSAEVLPGFARAVELAFGLDTVNKVDTLVASQNRLTTAWQNFVKNLTGEGSVIKGFLKGIFEFAEDFVEGIDKLFNSEEVGNASSLEKGFENQTKAIQKAASKQLDDAKKNGEKLADLQKASTLAVAFARGKLEDDVAHVRVQKAVKALLDYQSELDVIEQKIAKEKYAATFTAFAVEEQLVKEHLDKISALELKAKSTDRDLVAKRSFFNQELRRERDKLTAATLKLNEAEGKMNATRRLAEESKKPITESDDSAINGINKIADFEKKALAERLKTIVLFNRDKIKNADAGNQEIFDLIQETNKKELLIAAILQEDKIDILNKATESKIKAIKNGIEDESKLTKEQLDIINELRRQQGFQEEIIIEASKKKIEDINTKYASEEQKFIKKKYKFILLELNQFSATEQERLKAKFDKEIKKEGLSNGKKLKLTDEYLSDKKDLEDKRFNSSIDLMIDELKALASLTEATDAQKQSLQATIDVLEGTKRGGSTDDLQAEAENERLIYEGKLEMASRYSDAVTGLGSALFDNKIAEIDAEMEATREKYDELFLLAEGDAKQTRLLKIQEARDLAKLEEKKTKLLRKKAILEKANAIISIAINTAVAISKAAAQTGVGFVVTTPMLLGLAALQVATVLAQPLPKYAQGGVTTKDGPAIVGDGGRQEVIRTPDGKISLTPDTDTVVNLQKGTEIFSSVEKFNQQNPAKMSDMMHSASLLASISLNQKNINGMMSGQKQLDERLLDAMLLNTKAVKNSKSNTYVKTQKIDIAHQIWKSNLLN